MAAGAEINIDGLQEAINKVDRSVKSLATTTRNSSKNIINAFKDITTQGVDALINKLGQMETALKNAGSGGNNVGQKVKDVGDSSANAADKIVKMTDAIAKQGTQLSNWDSTIKKTESEIKKYEKLIKDYEEKRDAFNTPKSKGPLSRDEMRDYEINKEKLRILQEQKQAYEKVKSSILAKSQALAEELKVLQQLTQQETKRTSFPTAQKDDELKRMGEFYRQLDATNKKEKELYEQRSKNAQLQNQQKNTTYEGALKFSESAKTEERQAKAIEYLIAARKKLTTADADYANKLENINQAIRKHEENLKRSGRTAQENAEIKAKAAKKAADAQKKANAEAAFKKNTTYFGAIAYSQQTQSINEQIKAIQYLKIARDNLDKSTMSSKAYEGKVKRINDEIKRQQTELRKLQGENHRTWDNMSKSLDKLQGRLTAVFGLAAIKGYISKLIAIRGEFEMQKRSLEVLLQSKDKADKLWKQTVDLAVKSPFTTKELVTYTKQLAAYRIESDKLFETNKMLADVSAGLGVDMNRLILAFGQVKAANFLRGTELRQFSEAGVNMLDELAKRFSALEGKAVSVGDVFERVSKRMVSFKDVEAVFQTITSEGGIFYEMQAKQSETLKGMVLNLKDSVDLMMNSIGESQSGVLKGGVEMIKSFVENWRTLRDNLQILLPTLLGLKVAMFGVNVAISKNIPATLHFKSKIMGMNGATMTTLATFTKAEAKILGFSRAQLAVAKAMQKATLAVRGLKIALSSFLPFAILTAVVELGYALFSASEAAKALEEGLEAIDKDISKDLENDITLYIQLAEKIRDVTTSEQEREKALQKISSALSEILPDEMLQLKYIQDLKGDYEAATQAMKDYYTAKRVEQKKEKVEEVYGGEIDTQVKDLKKDFYDLFDTKFKRENIDYRLGQGVADKIVASYRWAIEKAIEDFKSGKISDLESGIYENLSQYTGVKADEIYKALALENQGFEAFEKSGVRKNIRETVDAIKTYHDEMNDIMSDIQNFGTHEEKQSYELSQEVKADVDNALNKWKSLLNIAKQVSENKPDENGNRRTLALDKEATSLIEQVPLRYQESVKTFWDLILEEAEKGTLAFNTSVTNLTDALNENVSQIATAANEGNTYVKNFGEELSKSLDSKNITKQGAAVTKVYQNIAKSMKVDENIFDKFILTPEKSIDDILKSLKAEGDALKEEARKIGSSVAAGLSGQEFEDRWGFVLEEAEAKQKELITKSQAMTKAWEQLGGTEKGKKGGADTDWYLELAKGLQSVHKDFLTLNKDLFKTRAEELAMEKNTEVLKTAFTNAGIEMKEFMSSFDLTTEQGFIDALEALLSKLPAKAQESKIAIEKILSDVKGEAELSIAVKNREATEKMLDDMFQDYELTMELESEGLDADWFGKMFGFTPTTLDDIRNKIKSYIGVLGEDLSDEELIKRIKDSKLSDELKSLYVNSIKRASEAENKALEDMMKTYMTNLKNGLSDRLKIWDEYYKEEKKIKDAAAVAMKKAQTEEDRAAAEAMKHTMLQGAENKRDEALKRDAWERFKGSDSYLTVMNNIDMASEKLLKSTLDKLKDFKEQWEDMPYSEMKKIVADINKIEDAITNLKKAGQIRREIKKTIFEYEFEDGKEINQKGLKGINTLDVSADLATKQDLIEKLKNEKDIYTQIGQYIKEGRYEEAAKLINILNQNTAYQGQLNTLMLIIEALKEKKKLEGGGEGDGEGSGEVGTQTSEASGIVDNTVSQIEQDISTTDKQVENGTKILAAKKAIQKADEAIVQMSRQTLDYANNLYSSLKELSETLGAGDGVGAIFADMGMQMLNTVANTIMLQIQLASATVAAESLGAAMKSAMGPIGWIVMGLELVIMGLTAIFKAHDKGLEKQIEGLQDGVDTLEKAYEKLEKAMERANSTAAMKSNFNAATENLRQQADAYSQMAALEEQKKNSDADKVKEYQEKRQEALEKQKELLEEQVESFGATYDFRSVAEDFVSAWADAFQETGNGLSGLETAWDDYFNNIMKNMIAQKGATKIMEGTLDSINKALEDDFEIDEFEYAEIQSNAEMAKKELDAYLQSMKEMYPEVFEASGGDTMSGLQRGIHELSEDTGGVIAAYLDSIRFFVSDSNMQLKQLVTQFNVEAFSAPIVAELQAQTRLITSIDDRLASITRPESGTKVNISLQ